MYKVLCGVEKLKQKILNKKKSSCANIFERQKNSITNVNNANLSSAKIQK